MATTVVHDNDVEGWRTDLPSERAEAVIEGRPVVIDSDDDAEERRESRGIVLRIGQSYNRSGTLKPVFRIGPTECHNAIL